LLYTGSYPFFEKVVAAMYAALLAGVIYTLFQVPLPAGQIARGLVPCIPKAPSPRLWG
jgi:XapX domain-containing protein